MYKLLIEEEGAQRIVEVGSTGYYNDQSKVIWDEREHGKFPEVALGGLKLEGSKGSYSLATDAIKKTAHDSTVAATQAAHDNDDLKKEDRLRRLKDAHANFGTMSAADKDILLHDLLEIHLGL